MSFAALKIPIPVEVMNDPSFDRVLHAIERVFDGVDAERSAALDAEFRRVGLDPQAAWGAMAMAACGAVAMLYVQRDRPEQSHG